MSQKPSQSTDASDYKLDQQVGFILRRANQRHLSIFAGHIGDLTPRQFAVLAKLAQTGAVSQNELGRQTAMDGATIKGVVDRLRKRDFIFTRPDLTDMRRILVEQTAAGAETYHECARAALEITKDTLAPLDEEEQAQFLELLKKLT